MAASLYTAHGVEKSPLSAIARATMSLQAIRYHRGNLEILDQLLLPDTSYFFHLNNTQDAWDAIKKMQVRGAPAIAIVGCLSLAVELNNVDFNSLEALRDYVAEKLNFLVSARPTAVNMAEAAVKGRELVKQIFNDGGSSPSEAKMKVIKSFEEMLEKDIDVNKNIGRFGAKHILSYHNEQSVNVITHCNTGSLATAGYGTALGVIRCLHEHERLTHVYCTETRPYNQGARLTAYELVHEKIPASLICDSMAAACMKEKDISAVIVGADRVVANGDTANKIGTYQLAIVAKHHNVPFYVACPQTTFDPNVKTGKEIVIEQRPHVEMTSVKGVNIAAPGINCWNPAFDVTPHELITGGIITEFGVFDASTLKEEFAKNSKDMLDVIY